MKIFKNRFGRQPIWWHILNMGRILLSIFIPSFRIDKYPNRYEMYKGDVGPLPPKKWDKRDVRKWTTPVLAWSLVLMIWISNETLYLTEYDYITINSSGTSNTVANATPNNNAESDESTFTLSLYDAEQLEGLANTIAGQNAIWPGYKGDEKDNRAVQRHFQEQFAKFINSGIISVEPDWLGKSVAFAYVVTPEGVLVFMGAIPGGTITAERNPRAYESISNGISGRVVVTPAQDEAGENIYMIYRIKVNFSQAY